MIFPDQIIIEDFEDSPYDGSSSLRLMSLGGTGGGSCSSETLFDEKDCGTGGGGLLERISIGEVNNTGSSYTSTAVIGWDLNMRDSLLVGRGGAGWSSS